MAISVKDIQKALQYADLAVDGLGYIGSIVGPSGPVIAKTAEEAVAIVKAVIDAIEGFKSGTITADDVKAAILKMQTGIKYDDNKADADLDNKFKG